MGFYTLEVHAVVVARGDLETNNYTLVPYFMTTPSHRMFIDSALLITGGTGSFGHAVLEKFLHSGVREIRIFSRDEKKQDDMRKRFHDPKLKFYIGDVRDYHSVDHAMTGVDYVFHAAALKQVPSCEFYPLEAVKTNILGAENVMGAAIDRDVKRIVCLSTDKAVYPINAMGISKAMMEKLVVAKSRLLLDTNAVLCATRYGNVMASRGSVIPMFVNQVLSGSPITITDPNMTRFMMTLGDAVELVLHAFQHGTNGDIFVQKAPSATTMNLAIAVRELLGKPDHPMQIIGTRHGEKEFETLLSREEMTRATSEERYYRVAPDLRDLNYEKFFEKGETTITASKDYNSHNTDQLTVEGVKSLLQRLDYIKDLLGGRKPRLIE